MITTTSYTNEMHAKSCFPANQLSIFQSILLHLLPGALITIGFVFLGPWLKENHLPPLLSLLIPILLILIPFELGFLFVQGIQRNRKLSLDGVVLNLEPLKRKDYLLIIPVLLIWAIVIFLSMTRVDEVILHGLFGWLPNWFQINQVPLGEYSQTILTLTFLLFLVVNGFAGPVVEELYFRGYLLPRIEYLKGWAPLVNVLLFSLYHFFSPWQFFTRILAFFPMAYFVRRKNNIYLSIAAHSLLNTGYCFLAVRSFF